MANLLYQFAECSNFLTHLNLRSLRPDGSRKRAVPYGYGFNWVSFPNYFFEILGWVAFTVMTGSWASEESFPPTQTAHTLTGFRSGLLFLVVGSGTMALWAVQKHKKYKKEFGSAYPRNRKIIVPFVF